MLEQDLRGVCEECGRPFVLSAAELRYRAIRPGQSARLCSQCLIAAAHERRTTASTTAPRQAGAVARAGGQVPGRA